MKTFSIAIHGGAGTILPALMTPQKELAYRTALSEAIQQGSAILEKGGTSLDAVEAAVVSLENFPLFNAGKGAVFTHKGTHEMDASIMSGLNLNAGAVSGVSKVKNPISLARLVMEKSGHKQWQDLKDSDTYQLDHTDKIEQGEKKFGTVGAVALDLHGNLAAATSTGGMTNKKFGRVGDTPIIGAGTYANNHTCAISCTGHGEYFIRAVVAYDISCLMEYKGLSLKQACDFVVKEKLVKMGGEGGLIAIDKIGNIELPFNSDGMYRAFQYADKPIVTEIYK